MRDLDPGQGDRALVLADDRHDLIVGDQLLDGGAALLRYALMVLDHELERTAQHAAGVVDDLGCDFQPVLDLGCLAHRAWRREAQRDAELDRIRGGGVAGKSQKPEDEHAKVPE